MENDLSSFDDFEEDNNLHYQDFPLQPLTIEEVLADPLPYFLDLWRECGYPVAAQSLPKTLLLVGSTLLLTGFGFTPIPPSFLHCLSCLLGVFVSRYFFPEDWRLLCLIAFYSSLVFFFSSHPSVSSQGGKGFAIIAVLGVASICEIAIKDQVWHRLRGPALLMAMRVISSSLDGVNPSPAQFAGYLMCPGTIVFGPWISFADYSKLIESRKKFSLFWLLRISAQMLLSWFFLFGSVCFFSVFSSQLSDPIVLPVSLVRWRRAYLDAASFRFSHYFVCFVSRSSLLSLGGGLETFDLEVSSKTKSKRDGDGEKADSKTSGHASTPVSIPFKVELPRSLEEVVIFWNMPMHRWLKHYVFLPSRPLCGTALALLATYVVSSLLHGLNFQLAAVLLSLGFYSYTEHVLRAKLARIFSACVGSRPCRDDCDHEHKQYCVSVSIVNLIFGAIAVFHLAYLGVAFDNSDEQAQGYSMSHVIGKWKRLNFASPVLALFCYVFYTLI